MTLETGLPFSLRHTAPANLALWTCYTVVLHTACNVSVDLAVMFIIGLQVLWRDWSLNQWSFNIMFADPAIGGPGGRLRLRASLCTFAF